MTQDNFFRELTVIGKKHFLTRNRVSTPARRAAKIGTSTHDSSVLKDTGKHAELQNVPVHSLGYCAAQKSGFHAASTLRAKLDLPSSSLHPAFVHPGCMNEASYEPRTHRPQASRHAANSDGLIW